MNKIFNLAFILLLFSCAQPDPNREIDEGKVEGEMYTSEEIGWTMEIPKNWTIIKKDKLKESDKRGMDLIEEVYEGDLDYSGLKHLLSFQKDQFNIFQSTSEPFNVEEDGEWEENYKGIKELLYATFTNNGMNIDTSSSAIIIDGLSFKVFYITLYSSTKEIILHQEMYSRLINGLNFGVNINYTNEEDKKTMQSVWMNSSFKK